MQSDTKSSNFAHIAWWLPVTITTLADMEINFKLFVVYLV